MSTENIDRGDDFTASDEPAIVEDQEEVVEGAVIEGEATEVEDEGEEGTTKIEAKEPHIPKSRFDKAVSKARKEAEAANAKATELEAKLRASQGDIDAKKVEEELDQLENDLEKAIADGNAEAKKRIRQEIRAKNQSLAEARAAVHSQYATAVAIEQVRYDALVSRMEVEHPELNPDNEDSYDEEVVAELQEFKDAFEAKGLASSEALNKALKAVYRGAKVEAKKEKEETEEVAAQRKEEAVKRGIDAKKKQPTNVKGVASDKAGIKGKTKDPSKMTDAELDALPKEEIARMRGDIL